ncbi:hypothetical protein LIER_23577 [Lithospermum erythrorhizon]|uniref:Retrotransposon gag domain-containing protein n=1 Tax=Lithospermum erythrorhizon TaxID=34254 RepID=A0AAV3QZJ8_LITER
MDIYAKAFPNSLTGAALDWYMELPPDSIDLYGHASDAFISKYSTSITNKQDERALMDFQQFPRVADSRNSRKIYARRDVYSSTSMPLSAQVISFSDAELRGLELPHDDPVIIALVIANYAVERILVDTGSSADILYLSTYDKLGLALDMLHPMTTPLTGFISHSVYPKGIENFDFIVASGDKKIHDPSIILCCGHPGFGI